MATRSKVELFEQIRKTRDREGLSVRGLARRFNVHRRTVRQALESTGAAATEGKPVSSLAGA